MQITEVTGLAVRSAAITLRRQESPMEFRLFPMVHFAAPSFYAQVRRRPRGCALIVAEGVAKPAQQPKAVNLTNRFFPRSRQDRVVAQTDEAVLPEGVPVIRPDVSPAEPVLDLRGIPGLTRMATLMGVNLALISNAEVVGTALAVGGPRVLCTKDLEIHDFPFTVREEQILDTPLAHMAMDARDQMLLEALARVHEARALEPIRVGVVYGAAHMPAVSNGLADRFGYRPRDAEWMTVFAPD